MAQYRLSVNVIGRSSGRSATGAAAYRSGERLVDERTGIIHDYTRKEGVLHTEILAPDNAPDWMQDRAQLWNAVEAAERRKDAQLCREIQLSLPHELTRDQQISLVRRYVQDQHVSQGMIADVAIHAPSPHELASQLNYHAHVLLSMRELTGEGFGQKAREWNDKQLLENWREQWAIYQNRELQRHGHSARVDHRSLEDQGIDREPQFHLGPSASEIERSGRQSRIGDENRAVDRRNGLRADLVQAGNLIDAKLAFEKRKFEAWAEKKRGQLEVDEKRRVTQYQLGLTVRMKALDEAIKAEFGDTKQHLTAEHDEVASNLASTGWRKFIRDITFTTRRDRQELERLERELEQTRQAEELKRQQVLEQEQRKRGQLKQHEQAKKENLEKGIQKARERREATEWSPLPSSTQKPLQRPENRLQDAFNKASHEKSVDGWSDSGKSTGSQQPPPPDPKRSAVEEFRKQMEKRRNQDRDRER